MVSVTFGFGDHPVSAHLRIVRDEKLFIVQTFASVVKPKFNVFPQ